MLATYGVLAKPIEKVIFSTHQIFILSFPVFETKFLTLYFERFEVQILLLCR